MFIHIEENTNTNIERVKWDGLIVNSKSDIV